MSRVAKFICTLVAVLVLLAYRVLGVRPSPHLLDAALLGEAFDGGVIPGGIEPGLRNNPAFRRVRQSFIPLRCRFVFT